MSISFEPRSLVVVVLASAFPKFFNICILLDISILVLHEDANIGLGLLKWVVAQIALAIVHIMRNGTCVNRFEPWIGFGNMQLVLALLVHFNIKLGLETAPVTANSPRST
jgi:hypothetical protein